MIIKLFNGYKYSNGMDDISNDIDEYNPNKKTKYWSCLMILLLICFLTKIFN